MQPRRILFCALGSTMEKGHALRQMMERPARLPLDFLEVDASAVSSQRHAWPERARRFQPDVVVLFASLKALRAWHRPSRTELAPGTPVIAITEEIAEPEAIMEALENGVSDFVLPPLRAADVLPRLWRLLESHPEEDPSLFELKQRLGLQQFVGQCPVFLAEVKKIPRLARCEASVLIAGETGTGKEVCARAIHYLSSRAGAAFVPINCGAIPTELLENELFGHESGAYTGAASSEAGLIQEADGGTLFLDEVDALALSAQVKLLRFLQEKEYRRLGSRKVCKADVRIVAASNVDLATAVKAGRFRQDLFFRLGVLHLRLPALRQRPGDIPLLASHFLAKHTAASAQPIERFEPEGLRKLSAHSWPGNVRELENIVERAIILCEGRTIGATEIELPAPEAEQLSLSFRDQKNRVVENFEREFLEQLLARHHGNVTHAAIEARKNRRALFELIRKHHLHPRDYCSARP